MKQLKYILLIGMVSILSSCVSDLLDRQPTTEVSSDVYWNSPEDALSATYGVYDATRTLFRRDYYFDGHGEFHWTRGTSGGGGSFSASGGSTSGFDQMWKNCYQVINRANFTIENIEKMIESTSGKQKEELQAQNGENYFLRSLAYFRLIQLWGDVPYYRHVLKGHDEAISLSRTPIADIKKDIIEDLTYAISVLPSGAYKGRATQAAAYGFRAKVELFWASWKKNGWPELDGFTQDQSEAQNSFRKAADDFAKVINDYGLKLFSEGNPGTYEDPSYWHLFQHYNEYSSEIIFSVQHAGPSLGQGEEMQRDFGTRSTGNAQCWLMPTIRLVDRYQSLTTGDFVDPLVLSTDPTLKNGSINRETYENRDWRMKATLLWDGEEMVTLSTSGLEVTGKLPFKYGQKDGVNYINYDVGTGSGYIYRKWVRNTGITGRSDGPQDFYLMRLADVYLMYSEAVNELEGPTAETIGLINKIRHRGNLPELTAEMYANKEAFFKAIEQERIVELISEGQRPFDIRRWRKVEDIWGAPNGDGWTLYNTHNVRVHDQFKNANELNYQRYYIYKIPQTERDRNPNLTQNRPWL
ncbi:RagB/SusD family nutrient uptake outer membrane protein [Parabacteroides sp. 52]|uniref:RagB/SusD family nutrient uptake outer membrane protein n=1 Tax=unclassified Parabacteroides TaxID=2649774 RepID=UPI0013D75D48|nr:MULTISPECIES: RagB/SusD family nutrient uptake outer membrane protein [unclassified Parabacteroides]MDH6534166.1 hypothetical protein [Parabacteroides sp. PM5-20]NDV54932.1 RagB/SusD family nutrient uptake outer membrane protein [Parabacteroides sp. 52]